MKQKLLLKSLVLLFALIVGSTSVWAQVTWERVTSIATLRAGGTFIMGYEADHTGNPGVIVPLRTDATAATTSSNGMLYSGTGTGTTSNNGTINMSTVTVTDKYELYITASTVTNAINMQLGSSTGNYIGCPNSKNTARLYTSASANTAYTLTVGDNDVFTLECKAADTGDKYKYLKFNNASGSYRYANYKTTPEKIVFYKKVEAGAATTVTINSTGITNTNKFFGTAAGSLTAAVTVTATSAAVEGAAVTWTSSNETVATVGGTTGVVTLVGEGSTTITASYAGKTGEYKSSSAEYVLNVTDEDPNAVTLWSEDFGSYSANAVPSGGTYSYTCQNGGSDTKVYANSNAGGESPELLVSKGGGYFQAVVPLDNISGDLKLKFKSNANAITMSTSTDGISISGDADFSSAGVHTVTFTGVSTNKTSITIKFATASESSNNVRIDDIVLKGSQVAPVTISEYEWATFVSDKALDFDGSAVKAYIVTGHSGTALEKTQMTGTVPANTPLLLNAAEGSFSIPVVASSATDASGNLLKAGDGNDVSWNPATSTAYVLSGEDGTAQFKKLTSAVAVPEGKAYLLIPEVIEARDFDLDDGTTVINALENATKINDGAIYDLSGRRVENPTKGIYIMNGKKVIFK